MSASYTGTTTTTVSTDTLIL